MATRLARLLLLIETGSTQSIRKAAALQLGDFQKFHPHEFYNLVHSVHSFLRSKSWETRIAAGIALEAIASNVAWEYDYNAVEKGEESTERDLIPELLSFETFNMEKVLQYGAPLLASVGKEYDVEWEAMDHKERLKNQRKDFKEKLGLGNDVLQHYAAVDDLIGDEDFSIARNDSTELATKRKREEEEMAKQVTEEIASNSALSAREKNRLKRLAKSKQKEGPPKPLKEAPRSKSSTDLSSSSKSVVTEQTSKDKIMVESIQEKKLAFEPSIDWPFQELVDELCHDLFHASWEIRHGAAIGIREILRIHGKGMGMSNSLAPTENQLQHRKYLEDLAIRLICVFALDRFGDFVSDQVVAPVRETCAQTLGVTLKYMSKEEVGKVLSCLLLLQNHTLWEIRHGGLLGLRFILAVRTDLATELLPYALPSITSGLLDRDDDVRAVAADSLLPVCTLLPEVCGAEIPHLLRVLWDSLLELDDLTASTSSVMQLLSQLCTQQSVQNILVLPSSPPLESLLPRLWPFFRHNVTAVRHTVLKTVKVLFGIPNSSPRLMSVVKDACRHCFQNIILEENEDVLQESSVTWEFLLTKIPAAQLQTLIVPSISSWLALLATPPGSLFAQSLILISTHAKQVSADPKKPEATEKVAKKQKLEASSAPAKGGLNEDLSKACDPQLFGLDNIIRNRNAAAIGIASLLSRLPSPAEKAFPEVLETMTKLINSDWAFQRRLGAIILQEASHRHSLLPSTFVDQFLAVIFNPTEQPMYRELQVILARIRGECVALVNTLGEYGAPRGQLPDIPEMGVFSSDLVTALTSTHFQALLTLVPAMTKKNATTDCEGRKKRILMNLEHFEDQRTKSFAAVAASFAGALVATKSLPEKLNPVLQPLMNSLKLEEHRIFQERSAQSVGELILLLQGKESNPSARVVRNLATFACSNKSVTPQFAENPAVDGILTYRTDKPEGKVDEAAATPESVILRRGAVAALRSLAASFADKLFVQLNHLWAIVREPLDLCRTAAEFDEQIDKDPKVAQDLITSLQILTDLLPALHASLHGEVIEIQAKICELLGVRYSLIRSMAAKTLGAMGKLFTLPTLENITLIVAPFLDHPSNIVLRQGAAEAIYHVIHDLDLKILPFLTPLVSHILRRMSDQDEDVRHLTTYCFGQLVRLMPLEASVEDPPGMSEGLKKRRKDEREFLEQLLDSSKITNFKIPVTINAQLRNYQQEGVNWLSFLHKYNLHGVLCDDMGLGKTLQTLCIMASSHHSMVQKIKAEHGSNINERRRDLGFLPSLVICPQTVAGHWHHEIKRFTENLRSIVYAGSAAVRKKQTASLKDFDVVVTSYEVVRNDVELFKSIRWNYCILDEGHVIKNPKSKLSQAVRSLSAEHRLMLSGTPIQNNVLELWSIFDFLMPGFLGTQKQFNDKFGKPILASGDPKSTAREQEAGALALESLHKQVLPFLLRRMKEDVLHDLPPKIIQDYYCELSTLQKFLYEKYHVSNDNDALRKEISEDKPTGAPHAFQALQYLRKVCNHPALVLGPQHPFYASITRELASKGSSLRDLEHAPKLLALKQLLLECGIGPTPHEAEASGDKSTALETVNHHRALIFCQLKSMVEVIEEDVLKPMMPHLAYLKLDGSVDPSERFNVVQKFNEDPSIDVLLLTTHVGGVGLNLTGADTVIFVEHDWNPTKDLQAMDRAHRIGQKKVVNVYRLITRGTLEEKIMGLQQFKTKIANTVVNQENSSLASMGTDQLLDLFKVSADEEIQADTDKEAASASSFTNAAITGSKSSKALSDLLAAEQQDTEEQYRSDLNTEDFLKKLRQDPK